MEVLWYCPKCGYEEIKNKSPRKNNFNGQEDEFDMTWINLRDGYGTPIRHFLCSCGNKNAGAMDFRTIKDGYTDDNVRYFKGVIKMYQDARFGIKQ